MAHKDNRSYYRSMQVYYRLDSFKALRIAARLTIAFIAMCFAPIVT